LHQVAAGAGHLYFAQGVGILRPVGAQALEPPVELGEALRVARPEGLHGEGQAVLHHGAVIAVHLQHGHDAGCVRARKRAMGVTLVGADAEGTQRLRGSLGRD
jgi:hypothetical protein